MTERLVVLGKILVVERLKQGSGNLRLGGWHFSYISPIVQMPTTA